MSKKISTGAKTWALVGIEVVAVGVGAYIGQAAAFYVALAGLLLFIPLAKEWIGNCKPNANQLLGFVHGDGKPYLQRDHSAPKAGPFVIHGALYTYRIGVGNRSDSTINDVEVKLTSIKECPNTFHGIGGNLHWMHDNQGQPSIKKSIPPTRQGDFSDAVFVDVLLCFLPDKPEDGRHKQLQICHTIPGVSVIIPFRSYELVVTANDPNQAIVATTLSFTVQEDGRPPTLKLKS